jgi:arsenate reductase
VAQFLPLLAERFARQRLKALARVEGSSDDGRPIVLFLCTHNAGRSQIALGFFQHYAGPHAVAWSGGTEPGSEINPAAIEVMAMVTLAYAAACGPQLPSPGVGHPSYRGGVIVRDAFRSGLACPVVVSCLDEATGGTFVTPDPDLAGLD